MTLNSLSAPQLQIGVLFILYGMEESTGGLTIGSEYLHLQALSKLESEAVSVQSILRFSEKKIFVRAALIGVPQMKVSQFDKVLHYFGNCGNPYIQAQIKALLPLHSLSEAKLILPTWVILPL